MSTPNPLIPQGTFQAQAAKGASNVRIAVATIVAIHVVFFGGLLLQGCKRDTQTTLADNAATNAEPSTNLALPPLDTGSLYYTNSNNLPPDNTSLAGSAAGPDTNGFATQAPALPGAQQTTPEQMWQPTNLNSPLANNTQAGAAQGTGGMTEYTVLRGDYLGKIARAHHTTVAALMAANPNVEPTRIKPGDKILIPEAAPAPAGALAQGNADTADSGDSGGTYTVKAGDNLTKIARQHKVTISQLRAANHLRTSRVIVGQKLKIPAPAATANTDSQRQQGL